MTQQTHSVPDEVVDWVRAHDDYIIASHTDPDGDSLGSSLALALGLESIGKRTEVVIAQPLPDRLAWLPGADRIRSQDRPSASSRAVILAECSDFDRSGLARLDELVSLNIDHHTKNKLYAGVNWIEPTAAATGIMVSWLLAELGAVITPEIAALLYVTVLTDTGSFRHSNTDAAALQFAADMVRAGAEPGKISESVYGNVAASQVQLMADALATLSFEAGGRIAWMHLGERDFAARGTRDTEGLINQAQDIAGVAVSMLFKQAGSQLYRVSLRSDGSADVAELAARYGGGGHPRASGCQIEGDFEAVRARLVAEAQRALAAGHQEGS